MMYISPFFSRFIMENRKRAINFPICLFRLTYKKPVLHYSVIITQREHRTIETQYQLFIAYFVILIWFLLVEKQ